MPDTSMTALMNEADRRGLIRKVKRAVAFLAPISATLPETLTGETGAIQTLAGEDWKPFGMVSTDGWNFGREMESEDTMALGYASSVRNDINSVNRTITVTPLEYGRKNLLELTRAMNLDGVTQMASGEIVFDEPELPIPGEYRLIVIGADGPADDEWILGKGFPRVKLSNAAEEVWGTEGVIASELTLQVFNDEEVGTPVRNYIGGTGAKKAADTLGFAQAGA